MVSVVGCLRDATGVRTDVNFFVLVVAVAPYLRFSGSDDAQTASNTAAPERNPVKVVLAGTNDAKGPCETLRPVDRRRESRQRRRPDDAVVGEA